MSEPWQEDERTQVECVNDAPLTFDEMAFAMAVANVAAGGMPNVGSVHNRGPINLVAEDGTVRQLRLTNRPLNRAMMAVMDAFSHDQAKQESASYRVLFFPRVMEWPEAKPFVRRDGGSIEVHHGLIETMGRCKFSSKHGLPRRREFRALLKACVAKHGHSADPTGQLERTKLRVPRRLRKAA